MAETILYTKEDLLEQLEDDWNNQSIEMLFNEYESVQAFIKRLE